jgi:hypothetical protein
VRDIAAGLLEAHGGAGASVRASLLARNIARIQVTLFRLEDVEASDTADAIANAEAIGRAASRLGVALRKLDALLASEAKPEAGATLESYLKERAAPAA